MRKVCHEKASVQALTIYVRSRKPFKIFASAWENATTYAIMQPSEMPVAMEQRSYQY